MFRNKEIRGFAVQFAAIAAVFVLAGAAVCPAAGLLALAFSAVSGAAFLGFTRVRYQRLARLADQIDRVLHYNDRLCIGEAEEGELSILESEITKMTLRIREQNDRLQKEKTRLADSLADIAHQLHTPLTSANLILSLLKKQPSEPKRQELLRESEELLMQMDWLVTSLLRLSRLDAGIVAFQPEPVTVSELLRSALRPLLISMDLHDIALQAEIPEGAVIVGDRNWLCEALRNVLKNGVESAGDHGSLEIHCTDTLLYTELSIHDSGKGFSPEDLHSLFDRFYRGNGKNAAGYGIGLALCKTIITRQGGSITAKNHPHGGAVFFIRFPK